MMVGAENRKSFSVGAFRTAEVARIVGVSPQRVRSWARAGLCRPARQGRFLEFTFQDLVLLRTARSLVRAQVPTHRIRQALHRLASDLPGSYPLSGLRIRAQGRHVIVREGRVAWQPESGQTVFLFDGGESAGCGGTVVNARVRHSRPPRKAENPEENAVTWFERALAVEEDDPHQACLWYRRAIDLAPEFADPYINLGRLIHDAGDAATAVCLYREALKYSPEDPVARYNLALAMEDEGECAGAVEEYRTAIRLEPDFADAHFNLAKLLEELGEEGDAATHFLAYMKLKGAE